MAEKLRVTWQDGLWSRDGKNEIGTADLAADTSVTRVGETLVFLDHYKKPVLVFAEARLILASRVEVEA